MFYTSKDNSKIKEIRKLHGKKYRDLTGTFLVEGYHLVEEALKAKALLKVLVLENEERTFPVETMIVTEEVMASLSTTDSVPPIMAVCKKMEERAPLGNHVLALDGIQDPGNLGTILRSAVAFSVDTVVCSQDTVDLYNPKVIRSSQGMIFHLNVIVDHLENLLKELKDYKIIGTKVTGGTFIKEYQVPKKYVLVMGNEGNGVRKEILSCCSDFVYIPMNQACESLNVGVATSILLYEFEKSE